MKLKTGWFRCVVLVGIVVSAVGCASLPHTQTPQVNAHRVELSVVRHDTVPVVLENGLGARKEWWGKVLPQLAADTTVFAYNRPGYGQSAPVSTARDGVHVVEELRVLLRSQGLQPPYILVGHSLGGLYMQLYTRLYPDEVAALVLVDSTHPRQMDGDGDLSQQSWWLRGLLQVLVTGVAREELAQVPETGRQFLALPVVSHKPVFVLSAAKPLREHSKLADDGNAKRRDIVNLFPGAQQIWVDSGHAIPLEKPEAIVAAIRQAQQAVAQATTR